jgi:hypothetical protein
MYEALKLNLQGLSVYKIARRLNLDPPAVYPSLKSAKKNFAAADKMLSELKALGWPEQLPEIERKIRSGSPKERKTMASVEIPFKMG